MKSLLRIKYDNAEGEASLRGISTLWGSLRNYEKNLSKNRGLWEYAIFYHGGKKVHYYHHSTELQRLSEKEYNQQLNKTRINLYIVPTYEYKQRTGQQRFKPIYGATVEDMPNYDNENVLKIQAYLDNKVIRTYQNGKFF